MTKTTPKRKRSSSSSEPFTPTHRSTVRELSRVDNLFEFVFSLLWFWGSNVYGQLGFGMQTTKQTRPYPGRIDEEVLDVATGGKHTVIIMMDGTVWSFGCNDDGALGRDTTRPGDEDGDPTAHGEITFPTEMMPIQVVCTKSASFILTEDGVVYGCGTFRNANGVLGFSPNIEKQMHFTRVYKPTYKGSPVSKLRAGGNHVIAIREDGSALSWGDGDQGQLGRIPLRTSRRSNNARNNMFTPVRIQGFRKIKFTDATCGEFSTFLKTSTRQFYGCGLNDLGQLAIHPTEVATRETLDLEDRVAKKTTILKPTQLDALHSREMRYVACGKDHSLGIDRRGSVYSWGSPTHGVLGRECMIPFASETTSNPTPMLVDGIDMSVETVSCGQAISGCIDEEGDFYTWGSSANGMLGAADDEDLMIPRKMPRTGSLRYRRFHKLAFGGQHVALLGQPKDTE